MSKQNITLRLDPETVKRLDQLAQAMDRDRSWLMSRAIERYIEEEAWQVKAIREAVQKVKEGRGRFVPHDEVARWLDSWGTDNEQPPPSCK
jgi:predicted transcriptional regulator